MTHDMSNAVQFFRPMPVTNARCCSDAHVMCDKCAAAALAVSTPVPNTTPAENEALVVNSTPDWDSLFAQDAAARRQRNAGAAQNERKPQGAPEVVANAGEEQPLTLNAAKAFGW